MSALSLRLPNSLHERARELASLRVLGFTRGEVLWILLLELALLTILAQPPGWLMGYGLAWIMKTKLAGELMLNSPSSVQATKKLINGFISQQLDQQIVQAIEDNARIRSTADFREGVMSFLQKRPPHFKRI